jgi:hypothetical protein
VTGGDVPIEDDEFLRLVAEQRAALRRDPNARVWGGINLEAELLVREKLARERGT